MLFGRRMPFTDLPIHRRILAMSSISGVVKLGYTDKKRWHDIALDRVDEIVSKGQLIVWPLDDRQVDQEQSQGELDLLLEKFDKAKKPCSVVQLNWHLLADPTHHAEAAMRYQIFDSLVRRSFATLERFWLSCSDGAYCTDNGIYALKSVRSRHHEYPLRSTDAVATLMRTLADLLNTDAELQNLRDLVVQWPILADDDDFKRPTLGGVIAAAPELRNLYVDSCRKLIDEENGQCAAAYTRNFDDFILHEPMTALELQRLSIGEVLGDYVDAHRFFDSIVELTAPKLRRIDFLSNHFNDHFNEVQEYNRESGRYRLLPSLNTLGEWFGAGAARRQMTPGSERPTAQLTSTLGVHVDEKDGETEVVMTVHDRGWHSKTEALDNLVRVKRECFAQPRHLRLNLGEALANDVRNNALIVPFHTKDFDGFDTFSLWFYQVFDEVLQPAVASLDSAWRERVWKLEIDAGHLQDTDECWHGIRRLLDVLPSVRRIDFSPYLPRRQGRRRQREWSVCVAAFIDQIERDGKWKLMRFRQYCWSPDDRELFYERSPRGIERTCPHRRPDYDFIQILFKFVRVGVTHQRWLSERGLVKSKNVDKRSLINYSYIRRLVFYMRSGKQ